MEILALARTFSKVSQFGTSDSDDTASVESVLFPLDVDRHGDPPLVVKDIPLRISYVSFWIM